MAMTLTVGAGLLLVMFGFAATRITEDEIHSAQVAPARFVSERRRNHAKQVRKYDLP